MFLSHLKNNIRDSLHQVLVRAEGVVGQCLPVRKQGAAQRGGEEGNFFQQALGVAGIGRDDGQRFAATFFALSELGQEEGVCRARRAGKGVAFAAGEFR